MAPYTQKILDDGNVAIWLVDGKYVRDNLEEEFIGGGHYLSIWCTKYMCDI